MSRREKNIYLGYPVRTPIGKFGGSLSNLTSPELGVFSATETIRRSKISVDNIDEVVIGNARQAGLGPNPARQVAYKAGLPVSTPAFTVNQACASGLKAIINGCQAIALEDAGVALVGGMESLSNVPYLLMNARWGYRLGHEKVVDAMYQDGYLCHLCDLIMGETADLLGEKYQIPRQASDEYAFMSQQRYKDAIQKHRFDDEIIPVEVKNKKSMRIVKEDEHPRPDTTVASLAKLKPVFKTDGTVTPGNASGITDGAATMLVFSEQKKDEFGLKPIGRIVDYVVSGVEPSEMGLGPVPAVRKILERSRMQLSDIDLIELNEAFAVQVLACDRELKFDMSKVNVNGGAIALGHPTGCTGARITVTLLHEMHRRNSTLGLATLCVSGGLGAAMLVEQV